LKPELAQRIDTILGGKSVAALDKLRSDAEAKINGRSSSGEAVDVPFWETLLKQMVIYRARSYLREFHQELLKKRLMQLKEQHQREMEGQPRGEAVPYQDSDDFEPPLSHDDDDNNNNNNDGSERKTQRAEDDGSFSPVLLRDSDGVEAVAIDPDQDRRELEARRRQVLQAKADEESKTNVEIATRRRDAAEEGVGPAQAMAEAGMTRFAIVNQEPLRGESHFEDDEVKFGDEVSTSGTQYLWHDKYRPRKPRYFNRVKTGYEWNKYNQTHYDKETPPPKIVQVYTHSPTLANYSFSFHSSATC
jgi:hypothetical protein